MGIEPVLLEQFRELFFGQACVSNQRTKRAFRKLAVIGHGQAAARRVTDNNVAAGLMILGVTDFAKALDGVRARTHRKATHTLTSTMASVMGGGMGSPCFLRLAR
jgi:hypothetical protein